MANIQYFYESIDFKLNNASRITKWILNTVSEENHSIEAINYIFCSDERLLQINRDYLDHDYFTDIITFNNSEKDKVIESDIFISIDRVNDNAKSNGIMFTEELSRVMIHGILHLVGYNDKSQEEQMEMREKENAYLSLLEI